jgi:hypothetical protein
VSWRLAPQAVLEDVLLPCTWPELESLAQFVTGVSAGHPTAENAHYVRGSAAVRPQRAAEAGVHGGQALSRYEAERMVVFAVERLEKDWNRRALVDRLRALPLSEGDHDSNEPDL